MANRSRLLALVGILAIAACSSDPVETPDAPKPDAPAPIPDAVVFDAPTDAGVCSVAVEVTPAHPVAPATLHGDLAITGCAGAAPVARWSVVGPDGQEITVIQTDQLTMSFTAPTPGTYTVSVGYLLFGRIGSGQTITVDVG